MATAKKTTSTSKAKSNAQKMTAAQVRVEYEKIKSAYDRVLNGAYCYMCDTHKSKEMFYMCTDPNVSSGVTRICKDCANAIALRRDVNGEDHEPTKDSIIEALMYLDKPFYESLYVSSEEECMNENSAKLKLNTWNAYIKNVSMRQYNGDRFKDSDIFKTKVVYDDERNPEQLAIEHPDQDSYTDYLKNRKDVIRLIGYDPFNKEAVEDQPLLYSQLIGMIDAGGDSSDDMMRTASAISIVRGFLQNAKTDNTIASLMSDTTSIKKNSAVIKQLQESKARQTSVIKDLAAESCISLKNSKNAKKGENTWTGKLRKIRELNLREGEVNGFDINTCRGMRQVMDMSNASILAQLRLDESEYSDMLAEQREMLTEAIRDRDNYKEVSRILLRENMDLKDLLEENNMLDKENLVDLNDLFSCFGEQEEVIGYDETEESESSGSEENTG